MKYVFIAVLFSLVGIIIAGASDQNSLELTEISTGSEESASAEFVEIINLEFEPVFVEGYRLQYKSTNGDNWITKATLSGEIAPRARVLHKTNLASEESGFSMSSGLAASGGSLRIVDENSIELDVFSWGAASNEESILAEKLQSYKKPFDEDGVLADFWTVSDNPTPQHDFFESVEEKAEEGPDIEDIAENEVNKEEKPTANYEVILIEEFLADPKSPKKDSDDEYIVILNPSEKTINIEDYLVETGSNWRYSYTLESITLAPRQTKKLLSSETNLILPNSGSGIRILDPNGKEVDKVIYPKVKEGEVWRKDGVWKNDKIDSESSSVTSELEGEVLSDNSSTPNIEDRNVYQPPEDAETTELNNSILVAAAALALLYAIYEYKQDIRNRVSQFGRYVKSRKENRSETSRWRSNRAKK